MFICKHRATTVHDVWWSSLSLSLIAERRLQASVQRIEHDSFDIVSYITKLLTFWLLSKKKDIFAKTWNQIKRFYLHALNKLSLADRTIWQLKEFFLSANSFNIIQIACLSEKKSCSFCISSLAEDIHSRSPCKMPWHL